MGKKSQIVLPRVLELSASAWPSRDGGRIAIERCGELGKLLVSLRNIIPRRSFVPHIARFELPRRF
jgi:hypothetical protein